MKYPVSLRSLPAFRFPLASFRQQQKALPRFEEGKSIHKAGSAFLKQSSGHIVPPAQKEVLKASVYPANSEGNPIEQGSQHLSRRDAY